MRAPAPSARSAKRQERARATATSEFERCVACEESRGGGRAVRVRQARREPGAERQAAHERREHGARRGDGVSELKREQPRPRHFVDERGGAGNRVQDDEDPWPAGIWTARAQQSADV